MQLYFLYLYIECMLLSTLHHHFPLCGPKAEIQGGVELAVQARKLDLFWSGLRPVLDRGPQESKLHDVVQLCYTVRYLLPPFRTQDPEAGVSWALQICIS